MISFSMSLERESVGSVNAPTLLDTSSITNSETSVVIKKRTSLTFYAQIACLFIVIVAAVVNISLNNQTTFWISTLSLCVGSLLPNPKLSKNNYEKSFTTP